MTYPRTFAVASPSERPHQAHAENANKGDTAAFQTQHSGEAGDQNIWAFFNVPNMPESGIHFIFGHWGTMGKDGYTHKVVPGGKVKKMSYLEKRRPKKNWGFHQAMTLRKGPHKGAEHGPLDLDAGLIHAKRVGFQPVPELKDPRFGTERIVKAFIATFERHNVACWPKALVNLAAFEEKAKAFRKYGVTLAAIGGEHWQNQKRATVAKAAREGWPVHSW